ncbi:MAG: porin [Gammaproteobacteria bacterium]|nr:porin [Gammaproteobacteria bacterium]
MNKKLLTVAIGTALYAAGSSAYALEAKLSGQVNRALMWADDSATTELHNVDNAISSTRFRFTGSDDITPSLKAGVNLEWEYLSNSSKSVTQANKYADSTLKERIIEAYFSNDDLGRLSIGQGSGAADGGTEVDLSGTNVVQWAGVADLGGSLVFYTTAGVATTIKINDTINQQDFKSRYDRLRYDSPAFGPIKFAISTGDANNTATGATSDTINEAAVSLNTDLGAGGMLASTIGYAKEDTNSARGQEKTVGGSISWLAPFGLNLTYSHSNVQDEATPTKKDSTFNYVKVGYKFGDHAIAVDYGKGEDFLLAEDESTVYGLGYVYNATKWAELYAGAKIHSFDRPDTEYEDIKIVTVGTRLKF